MSSQSIPKQIADAIASENCEAIRRLFKENPEQVGWRTPFGAQTWLGYAAQIGKLNSAKELIAAGVDANWGDKRENRKPLCSAASNNHYDVAEYLLGVGADMDTSISVRNPLFAAIVGRSPEIVRLLLESGIDGSVRYDSETMKDMDAVAFALMRGETECARAIALWNSSGNEKTAELDLHQADLIAERNAHGRRGA